HVKDNKAQYFGAIVMAGATAAILFMRDCSGNTRVATEDLFRRGDGVCDQREAWPYEVDPEGRVKRDEQGHPVRNPHYSKEDCHKGDGVCDNTTDRAQLRDPAGNPIPDFMARDLQGREIRLPLEDENSFDCRMQPARDQPCGAVDPTHPVLTRNRI